jgi:hypothetical protein
MPIVMRETMGRELAVKSHHDVYLEMEIGSVIVDYMFLAFYYQHVTQFP